MQRRLPIPRPRSRSGGAAGAFLLLLLGGCYHYTPVPFETVEPQSTVRAHLTSEKTLELESELGGLRAQVEGEVLERPSGENRFLLAVPHLQPGTASSSSRMRQWVWIEQPEVIRVEVRSLDRGRTGLVVGAAGAVVGYLLYRALGGGSVDTEGNGGNGDPTP